MDDFPPVTDADIRAALTTRLRAIELRLIEVENTVAPVLLPARAAAAQPNSVGVVLPEDFTADLYTVQPAAGGVYTRDELATILGTTRPLRRHWVRRGLDLEARNAAGDLTGVCFITHGWCVISTAAGHENANATFIAHTRILGPALLLHTDSLPQGPLF